jgi:hypothetical protein
MSVDFASAETSQVRTVIEHLVRAHLDGTRLVRRVMLLQEVANAAEELASATFDAALNTAGDPDAIERAVDMGAASRDASEEEIRATIAWKTHLQEVDTLVREAEDLLRAL